MKLPSIEALTGPLLRPMDLPPVENLTGPLLRCFPASELAPVADITPFAWTAGGFAVASVALLATTLVQLRRKQRATAEQDPTVPRSSRFTDLSDRQGLDIWDEINRRYGAVHIAAVEHAIAAHGYCFGSDRTQEEHLPLDVRIAAADALIREREAFVCPLSSPAAIARAVNNATESGYSLFMVDEIVSTSRQVNKYIQRVSAKAAPPKPAAMSELKLGAVIDDLAKAPMYPAAQWSYEKLTFEAERQVRRQLQFLCAYPASTPDAWLQIKKQCFLQAEGVLHLWESLTSGIVLSDDLSRLQRIVFVDIGAARRPMQTADAFEEAIGSSS